MPNSKQIGPVVSSGTMVGFTSFNMKKPVDSPYFLCIQKIRSISRDLCFRLWIISSPLLHRPSVTQWMLDGPGQYEIKMSMGHFLSAYGLAREEAKPAVSFFFYFDFRPNWYPFRSSFLWDWKDFIANMGSSKKSCSKGILESCGLPGAQRIFSTEYWD